MNNILGFEGYVVSPGICQGDSGGPLFILEDKNFIITGRTTHNIKVGLLTTSR